MTTGQPRPTAGYLLALAAYGSWGIVPLYWKALATIPPAEVYAHRTIWSFVLLVVVVIATGRVPAVLAAVRAPRTALLLAGSAAAIAANGILLVFAIQSGRVVDGSLGYFLSPLVSLGLARVVLREPLSRPQRFAAACAAVGAATLFRAAGALPVLAVALAATFATYGLLRKLAAVDAVVGLALEVSLTVPLALAYLVRAEAAGHGAFGAAALVPRALLVGSGLVSAAPLFFFAAAARRIPLATLALLQYVAPTLQLALAVGFYGEHVDTARTMAFGATGVGLGVLVLGARVVPHPSRAASAWVARWRFRFSDKRLGP